MKSFSVDEIREIFESIVKNSDKHGQSYYTELDGTMHSTDVGYFEECMPYFLNDLERISEGLYDKDGNKGLIEKGINDFDTLLDALRSIGDSYVEVLTLLELTDSNEVLLSNFSINSDINTFLDILGNKAYLDFNCKAYVLNSHSYHIEFYENHHLSILVHITSKDQGK